MIKHGITKQKLIDGCGDIHPINDPYCAICHIRRFIEESGKEVVNASYEDIEKACKRYFVDREVALVPLWEMFGDPFARPEDR